MRMTTAEYQAWLARHQAAKGKPQLPAPDGPDHESDLHAEIVAEVKRRGWLAFHGAMAHRTYRTPGEPDFIVLGDSGRVWMIECKTAKGKLSPEQLWIGAHAESLGHRVHVVRSFAEFLEIVKP